MEMDTSTSEQIGFHKGALSSLAKERQDLQKRINVIEQLIQMHVSALSELGVDLDKVANGCEN